MEPKEPEEGFPTEIFAQTVPGAMLCPICHCVMRQAVTLMCRGSHKTCEFVPPFAAVKHPCEWHGPLEELAHHQTQECGQRKVSCTNPGCRRRCSACNLPGHLNLCQWKQVPCEKCGQVMARKDLQTHLATGCPAVEVPCPDCHRLFKRSTLATHRDQCPEAPLTCPIPGCDIQVARCRMDDHIAAAAPQHVVCLGCASNAAQQLLRDEVEALKKQVGILMLARTFPDPIPNAPGELLAHLRRTTRVLSGGTADKTQAFFAFDLQARGPIHLLVGLAIYPARKDETISVSCRPASCRAAPLTLGWGAPLGEKSPPQGLGQLVPIRFREPVTLAAGESVTFRCSNVMYCVNTPPGNEGITFTGGVGSSQSSDELFEPRGFAGEIYIL
ncbi:hypothetical protein PAPYR_7735 [Paratrimastix pyriformis]|uniref:TRAF-type domain-containing protein n=1 Tax=Paratrimastix pyriformis TaxID=342808 RepID=A0ABQ8UGU6_9EUKA|nr:hypothetical protein PAPYR_7735 [Paratrimastix pyriformis]